MKNIKNFWQTGNNKMTEQQLRELVREEIKNIFIEDSTNKIDLIKYVNKDRYKFYRVGKKYFIEKNKKSKQVSDKEYFKVKSIINNI